MERIPYLLRHGFDPTDCDNADNYFHPSDPLGPGPSLFGLQHQCPPRPLRPIPTDPFEAFRFFNRLQGLSERECVERNAYNYLNRPPPRHVTRRKNQVSRKVKEKVEKPDVIETFYGDELSNLYFYNPLHDLMKRSPFMKWLFGFEIVPGKIPDDSICLPPSVLSSKAADIVELPSTLTTRPTVEVPFETSNCLSSSNISSCEISTHIQNQSENLMKIEDAETVSHVEEISPPFTSNVQEVSDIESTPKYCRVESGFSSISLYRPRRLSATLITVDMLSMKGFIRLGVSLIKREMEVFSQSTAIGDLRSFVREFVSYIPHLY